MRRNCIWRQSIVSVKENDILTRACTETGVARSGKPLVFLLHTLHRRVTPNHLENVIRRTVVDDNDFSLTVRLRQGALDELQAENLPACNRE